MPDDYSFRMTDLEYKKYTLKSKVDTINDTHSKKEKFLKKGNGSLGAL